MAAAIQDYGTLSAFVHVRERKAKLNLALSLLLLYFLFILILFLPTDFFPLLISFSFPLLGYVRSIRDAFLPLARHADKLESTFLSLSLSLVLSLFSHSLHTNTKLRHSRVIPRFLIQVVHQAIPAIVTFITLVFR